MGSILCQMSLLTFLLISLSPVALALTEATSTILAGEVNNLDTISTVQGVEINVCKGFLICVCGDGSFYLSCHSILALCPHLLIPLSSAMKLLIFMLASIVIHSLITPHATMLSSHSL